GQFAGPIDRKITGLTGGTVVSARLLVIDANVDGKADLIYIPPSGAANAGMPVSSITDGTSNTAAGPLPVAAIASNATLQTFQAGDVNGDGVEDIVGFAKAKPGVLSY